MVDSNASLYLGEDMMKLHHEALETFREGGNDEVSATGGGGGGADKGSESPRIRSGSNALTGDVRVDAVGSQVRGFRLKRAAGRGSAGAEEWKGFRSGKESRLCPPKRKQKWEKRFFLIVRRCHDQSPRRVAFVVVVVGIFVIIHGGARACESVIV